MDGASVRIEAPRHIAAAATIGAFVREEILDHGVLRDRTTVRQALERLHGNWSIIVRDRLGSAFACVDRIRSFPLFYRLADGDLTIGSDPASILSGATVVRDRASFLDFKMAGYVTGRATLFEGLRQLPAGEYCFWDRTVFYAAPYYLFFDTRPSTMSSLEYRRALAEITREIFMRTIARLNGRPVLVSLSAGLDSRLVLAMLRDLGCPNVRAFSYGLPGNHEAHWARQFAQQMGVEWLFVPFSRAIGRRAFTSERYRQFVRSTHTASGVPYWQDVPAFMHFEERGILAPETVIINGLSGDFISGGHVPKAFTQTRVTREELLDAIITKHYSLWRNLHTSSNLAAVRERIIAALPVAIEEEMDRELAAKCYELWEWRERQTKYVVQGQHVYDAFGYGWELPLWDDDYLAFWATVPYALKHGQTLYRAFLDEWNAFGVFRGVRNDRYTSPRSVAFLQHLLLVTGSHRARYGKTLFSYWQDLSHSYAITTYRDYLRQARYHRNPMSYHVRHLLAREYGESL